MKIEDYITRLKNKNIVIIVSEGDLKIKGKKSDLTEDVIKEIKQKKQHILEFFKSKNAQKQEIPRIDTRAHYALSHAQRRLWVLDQLAEVHGLYNVFMVYPLESLNLEAFSHAMKALIVRHEVLRTTIKVIDGEPRQVIEDNEKFNFNIEYREACESKVDGIIEKELFHPFDLTSSPIKTTLIKQSDDRYVLVFVLHHIACDAWSMDVLLNDYRALYSNYLGKEDQSLPDLRVQYKDYTYWQEEQLKSGAMSLSQKYWLEKLSGELPDLKLPLDYKRQEAKNYKGAETTFQMSPKVTQALMTLADEQGSLFMTLVALVNALLFKYTDQKDIILGTPITARNHPDLVHQVGYYSNTIVLRTKLDHSDTFQQLLSRVCSEMVTAYEHQYYPFDLLVDELMLDRDMSRNPLFDVMISFQYLAGEGQPLQEWKSTEEIANIDGGVNKFDLTFAFTRAVDGSLHVAINYNTGLFKKEKVVRMSKHFKQLTNEIILNPQQPISKINYLPNEEEREILEVFNNTGKNYDLGSSIKELIEAQVSKSPEQICLISPSGFLTFQEMNVKANQLADWLINNESLGAGDLVGIAMGTKVERVIAIVAILKIGASYVPMDPDYPKERTAFVISDTGLRVLITDYLSAGNLDNNSNLYDLVFVEEIDKTEEELSTCNPVVGTHPGDVFAVLYTSGSTGQPKGVPIHSKGVVNRMTWLWKECGFTRNDIIYQKTPYVFDVSMGEIFMPLCFGAQLLIAESNYSQEIMDNIIKFKVTYVHFSPTMLNKFMELNEHEIDKITSLRYVFASGEELLSETVNRYYAKFKVPLINLYGPTEASIEVSMYQTRPGDKKIPIGKPIANVRLYILDNQGGLCPIGVPGEIGIAGIGLASGYLNQPERTAERFMQDDFYKEEGHRIYKTGDVGCWQEDGTIEFLGRKDNQVSINGSRIELGEIETRILEHPDIQEVTVVVTKDSFDNYHLMAYFVKNNTPVRIESSVGDAKMRPTQTVVERDNQQKNENKHREYNIKSKLHQLFERSVEKYPENIVLTCQNRELSYRELNEQSNRLARFMQQQYHVGSGTLVGILMERSEKMVIVILSILKAGGTYVPIDPEYPTTRVEYIASDAGLTLLITDVSNSNKTEGCDMACSIYDEYEAQEVSLSTANLGDIGSFQDLCYVCYTSGSTGVPKGVMVEHHSVIDYVLTFTDYFSLDHEDIVIQQSSLSFDTSVEEIFPILYAGGKLCILSEGGRNIQGIIDAVNIEKATVLTTTPLVINELNSRAAELERFPRVLISGGDELKRSYMNKLIHEVALYNTYGPTECTVCASFALVDSLDQAKVIGRPIANHKIYLVNEENDAVEQGEIGEIYIAGPGVARGYLNRELETAASFISNPFEESLVYKTGDLARWNEENMLEFCGRKDNQVKVKGYRVEPAEIDEVITGYDGVSTSLTMTHADSDQEKHLVTYYVSTGHLEEDELKSFIATRMPRYMVPDHVVAVTEFPRTTNGKIDVAKLPIPAILKVDRAFNLELRDFLKTKLPVYMIPDYFRALEVLPLTATGKVDRKKLESISSVFDNKQSRLKPANEVEKKILEIWKKCLKQTEIGTDSNFFEVGGNSLKATTIVTQIYRELNYPIPLKDIFNNPTIVEMARLITNQVQDVSLAIKLNTIEVGKPNLFFIPPIIGSSTIFKTVGGHIQPEFNAYGLQCRGFDREGEFHQSIKEMAESFVNEIKHVQKGGKIRMVGYSMGVPVAFEMAKILESRGYDVSLMLVDRGVSYGNETKPIVLDQSEVDLSLETELRMWFKTLSDNEEKRIKNLVFNNMNILDEHKISGKVRCSITAIQAKKNSSLAEMQKWQSYTMSDFTMHEMETHHYGILGDDYVKLFGDLIVRSLM